jgi:hypothetical protein
MVFFNIIFLVKNKISITTAILVGIMYAISNINYKYHVGEFWCYFVNMIPLLILMYQKTLISN